MFAKGVRRGELLCGVLSTNFVAGLVWCLGLARATSVVWDMSQVLSALARPPEKRSPDQLTTVSDFLRVFPSTSVLAPVNVSAFAERISVQHLTNSVPGTDVFACKCGRPACKCCFRAGHSRAENEWICVFFIRVFASACRKRNQGGGGSCV